MSRVEVFVKNRDEVRAAWARVLDENLQAYRLLVFLRHGNKDPEGGARGGLTGIGIGQCCEVAEAIRFPMKQIRESRGVQLVASNTVRSVRSLQYLFPKMVDVRDRSSVDIETPASLDIERVGDSRSKSRTRIRRGCEALLSKNGGEILIYSGNSPIGNESFGVSGELQELEALFFTWDGTKLTLSHRVAPQFTA